MVNHVTIASPPPQPTGRQLVFFKPQTDFTAVKNAVQKTVGRNTVNSLEFAGDTAEMAQALTRGDVVYVERFRVAAVDPSNLGINAMALQAEGSVVHVRPEFYMFAISDLQQRYASWAREGLAILAQGVTASLASNGGFAAEARISAGPFADSDEFTWGL